MAGSLLQTPSASFNALFALYRSGIMLSSSPNSGCETSRERAPLA